MVESQVHIKYCTGVRRGGGGGVKKKNVCVVAKGQTEQAILKKTGVNIGIDLLYHMFTITITIERLVLLYCAWYR